MRRIESVIRAVLPHPPRSAVNFFVSELSDQSAFLNLPLIWALGATRSVYPWRTTCRMRTTLSYRLHLKLTAGVEVNPRADVPSGRVSPLLNLLILPETKRRPAMILGTSSDRLGTPDGQSFYATFSKILRRETKLPIAPYAGGGLWSIRTPLAATGRVKCVLHP